MSNYLTTSLMLKVTLRSGSAIIQIIQLPEVSCTLDVPLTDGEFDSFDAALFRLTLSQLGLIPGDADIIIRKINQLIEEARAAAEARADEVELNRFARDLAGAIKKGTMTIEEIQRFSPSLKSKIQKELSILAERSRAKDLGPVGQQQSIERAI